MREIVLTPAKKRAEVKKQLNSMLKDVRADLLKDIDKALNSGQVPVDFMYEGDHKLAKCLLENFCIERPYKPFNQSNLKEYYSIQLYL